MIGARFGHVKIFFQSIFLLSAPGRGLGAVTFIMCVCVCVCVCVCARALARVRMFACACTWAPFSAVVTFMVCTVFTAGGKDSVVLSDTSCTWVGEIGGSGGRGGRGRNE